MKKIFTLLALMCMVCTGAWAEAYQSADLKNGMFIKFRSYYCNYFMSVGNQTNNTEKNQLRGYANQLSTGNDIFQLQGTPAEGFKLYNPATQKYIGKANGGSNTTVTSEANEAGVYKFTDGTPTDAPTRTGFTTSTKCVVLTCTSGTTADGARCMHQSDTNGGVVTWSATTGSCFVITAACEMPEEGEYYYLRPYYTADTYGYLYDNGSKLQANGTEETESAIFCAEKVNGATVAFRLANTNKYLRWTQGFDGTAKSNPNTGYNENYDATYNTMTIYPAENKDNQPNVMRNEYIPFLGLAAINGKGTDGNNYYFLPRMSDGGFVAGSANQLYFDNTAIGRTPYFKIEKVNRTIAFTLLNRHGEGTNSGLDGLTVGTFSSAYNVLLPNSDVDAYVATRTGDILYFERLDSRVIPANKGVLLYAENFNENYYGEVAYTDQAAPTVENNVLMPLLNNATVKAGDYVLTNAYNGVGFYPRATATTASNKAYIPAEVGAGIRGFVFGNEDDLTTAISQLSAQNSKHAAFDLAGRRVNAAVKGISIVNGKKFIK